MAAKTSVKKWICLFLNFINLSHFFNLSNVGEFFRSQLYPRSEKEKENCCLFTSSIKRETRRFHVVVIQKRVKHEQSCCFANLNILLFLPFLLPPRRRCLRSLIIAKSMTSAANRTLLLATLSSSLFEHWFLLSQELRSRQISNNILP